ncbi:hypothetical protein V6N13_140093 [Hibiscus sabdariffa]|uniref:Uncharacterized protein n=1 Tax=Hibiscus sabdariffa TaxID=183260 RepID=A0ABR2QB54_9ROSI
MEITSSSLLVEFRQHQWNPHHRNYRFVAGHHQRPLYAAHALPPAWVCPYNEEPNNQWVGCLGLPVGLHLTIQSRAQLHCPTPPLLTTLSVERC